MCLCPLRHTLCHIGSPLTFARGLTSRACLRNNENALAAEAMNEREGGSSYHTELYKGEVPGLIGETNFATPKPEPLSYGGREVFQVLDHVNERISSLVPQDCRGGGGGASCTPPYLVVGTVLGRLDPCQIP